MKKILCVLLVLLLFAGFAACGGKDTPVIDPAPQDGEPAAPETDGQTVEDEKKETEFTPTVEVADFELQKLVTFVSAFNLCPQEFTSTGELSDYTMFFAAAARMNAAFTPTADGATYSLPILELEAAVHAVFGAGASLSDGWTQNSYDPYTVDAANGVVLKSSMGTASPALYPYRCVKTDDGLELSMLALADPLFLEKYPAFADGGDPGAVTGEMVADIADEMMAYVYELRDNGDGSYTLAGFHFRNQKQLEGSIL